MTDRQRYLRLSGALIFFLVLSGCSRIPRGLLYTDIVEPLCTDARGSTLGSRSARGDTKTIEIPLTQLNLSAEWDSRAIGDAAKKAGLNTIHSCDLRREYYIIGIWRRERVLVYGE